MGSYFSPFLVSLNSVLPSPKEFEILSIPTMVSSIKPPKNVIYVLALSSAAILALGATVNTIFVPSTT